MDTTRTHTWVEEAPSTVDAEYVPESAVEQLRPGQKVDHLFNRNESQDYLLQRLTERTYWFQKDHYSTTFFVGEQGVLVFDAPERRGAALLRAISKVTPLPVTAISLSHAHYDHVGDLTTILAAAAAHGVAPRVLASSATARKLSYVNSSIPAPTEVLAWPQGRFTFEDLHVELHGFEHAAHCDDHGVQLLVEEKVLYAPDMANPDEPPFYRFSTGENFVYYEDNLRESDSLDWDFENAGHGNVGSHRDRAFYFRYLTDLRVAVASAMSQIDFFAGVEDRGAVNAHTAYLATWHDLVAETAVDAMRPRYGEYYGFEWSTKSNADMVAEYLFAYR